MERIKVGHNCPHCGKGVVLDLEVGIMHARGTVSKAQEPPPVTEVVAEQVQ